MFEKRRQDGTGHALACIMGGLLVLAPLSGCGKKVREDPRILGRIRTMVQHEEYKDAMDVVGPYVKKYPESPDGHYYLGYCNHRLGHYENALHAYQRALALDPDYIDALYQYGVLSLDLGFPEKARRSWEKAVQVNPILHQPHISLGDLAFDQKRYADAREEYLIALNLDPDNAVTWFSLCSTYYYLEEYSLAKEAYRKAKKLDPDLQREGDEIIRMLNEKPLVLDGTERQSQLREMMTQ